MATPVIIVHGGAWAIPEHLVQASNVGTKAAARAGYAVLRKGGSALDAVQASVRYLEDDPTFDAGTGSVLTSNGDVEMDSVIMDGNTLKSGAVAAVHNIKNPINLARLVMEKTDHCLLVGNGANIFAEQQGIKKVPRENLVSQEAIRELECYHEYGNTVHDLFRARGSSHDTVGAVAMDCHGNIAFATSTGGITCKKPGRVGDSPIMGAGGYADNEVGGVSCTGHGESIFKVVLAYQIVNRMRQGLSAQAAADKALANMAKRVDGYGGVIVINKNGDVITSFTTEQMAWAWVKDDTLHSGINPGEDFHEPVNIENGAHNGGQNGVTNGSTNGVTNGVSNGVHNGVE